MTISYRFWVWFTVLVSFGYRYAHALTSSPMFGHSRFYYWSSKDVFEVGAVIHMQYICERNGTVSQELEWSVESSTCVVFNSTSQNARLMCSTVGRKIVHLKRSNDSSAVDIFSIVISAKGGCFDWFPVIVRNDLFVELRTWVVDINGEDSTGNSNRPDELFFVMSNSPLKTPSSSSKRLSREMRMIGESPKVILYQGILYNQESTHLEMSYNNGGYWALRLPGSVSGETIISITGNNISVLGCSTRRKKFLFVQDSYFYNFSYLDSVLLSVSNSTRLRPVSAPCSPSVSAVLIPNSRNMLFTQSFYTQSSLIDLGQDVLGATAEIVDIALAFDTIVVAAKSGVFVISESMNISASYGLSFVPDRVSVASTCDWLKTSDSGVSVLNYYVTSWNTSSVGSLKFGLSANGGVNFTTITLPGSIEGSMLSALKLHSFSLCVTLVDYTNGTQQLWIYNEKYEMWNAGAIFEGETQLHNSSSVMIPSLEHCRGSGCIFILGSIPGSQPLFISVDGGFSAHQILLRSRQQFMLGDGLGNREYISQISQGTSGAFAVLSSTNRIFFGSRAFLHADEFSSSISPWSTAFLMFDTINRLFAVVIENVKPFTRLSMVHVWNEVEDLNQALSSELSKCQFVDKWANTDGEYYIDMNDVSDIHASLAFDSGFVNFLSVVVSDSNLVEFDASRRLIDMHAPYSGFDSGIERDSVKIRVFESKANVNFSDRFSRVRYGRGSTDLSVTPSLSSLFCGVTENVNRIRIGCPPSRHTRVRPPVESGHCSDYQTGRFDVGLYKYSNFGCPHRVFQQTLGFRPLIDLYDGDIFQEEILENFVLWEITGKTNFFYNATIDQVGCISQPVSWNEVNTSWFPEHYHDCFSVNAQRPILDGNSKYEIINACSINFIQFSAEGLEELMLFRLRVISPSYSYCSLEANFSVILYGPPLGTVQLAGIFIGTTGLIILILTISWLYYSHQLKSKQNML
eukprot:717317_1